MNQGEDEQAERERVRTDPDRPTSSWAGPEGAKPPVLLLAPAARHERLCGGRGHFTLRHNVLRPHLRLDPARAHARSGDPVASAEYLGTDDTLDNAIADFSTRYADQNQRDYYTFVKAIADGRIQT